MVTPLFLFGFERSGTTLLSMMMGAHPRISCPLSVTGLWWRYAAKVETFGDLSDRPNRAALVDGLLAEERVKLWNVSFDRDTLIASAAPTLPGVIDAIHRAEAAHHGKPAWALMDIATQANIETVAHLFPQAKFVQITRDGRDVALSFRGYKYGGLTTLEVADAWSRETVASDRIGHALGADRYLRIRYEDLILSPEDTLGKICSLVGETYEPEMLAYGDAVASKVPEDKRGLWPALDRPPQTDKVDRWRREMSTATRMIFEEEAGAALARFGYPVENKRSLMGEMTGALSFPLRGGRAKRLGLTL